jgi:hypothetical protein
MGLFQREMDGRVKPGHDDAVKSRDILTYDPCMIVIGSAQNPV